MIINPLLAFVVFLLPSLLSGVAHCQSQQFLGYTHCSQIDDRDSKQYCLDYINSDNADVKYSTAVLWSKYRPASFGCANITWSCLVSDLRAQAYGSSCTVAPNGSPCQQSVTDVEGSCWHGLCGDPAQVAVNMLLEKDGLQPNPLQLASSGSSSMRLSGSSVKSQQQQQRTFSNRRVAAQVPMPYEPGAAGFMQAGSSQGGADPYDYDSSLLPPSGSGSNSSAAGVPGAAADDPYGLNVQLPDNPLISSPFRPPGPAPVQQPPPPAPKPPPAVQRAQLTMDIQPDIFIGTVPASFLGVSREWGPQVYYDRNLEAFGNIFEVLGPAPIIRIGGASQESLLRPPNSTYLNSLKTLHCQLGIRYIIGLPLFQNAPELSLALKKTFDDAFQDYPFAILAYELGNEPNYWPGTGAGGVTTIQGATTCAPVQYNDPSYQLVGTMDTPTDKAGGVDGYAMYTSYQQPYVPYKASQYCFTPQQTLFVQGISSYQNFFQTTARSITGCGGVPSSNLQALWGFPYWGPPGFNRQVIIGPAWGDFATFDRNSLVDFLQRSDSCYLNEASLHYYGPNRNTTWEALFSKLTGDPTAPQGSADRQGLISTVRDLVQTARVANVGLRVSESNTVPDGGQSDFSNTLGAALWTLVTALEFAQAGTSGINFHWGNGGIPQNPGASPAYIGVQALFENNDPNKPYPSVRVPFYGYVMFSRALGGNGPGMFLNYSTNALSPTNVCNQFVYPYALLVPHAGMISVVVVNANANVTCDFTATLPGVVTTGAVLQRLVGPRGLQSVAGVTLAGQTYQGTTNGKLQGMYSPEVIQPHQETIRTTGWTFALSPGSGGLLQIPLSGGATNRLGYPPVTPNLVNGGSQQAAPSSSAMYSPPQGVTTTPPAGQAAAIQQMQAAAAAASPPPVAAGASSGGNSAAGFMSTDAAKSDGSAKGLTDGAGQYVLKGYAADGSAVYTWKAAAGSSYAADGSHLASDDLGAGFGQQVTTTAAGSPRSFGLGRSSSSSSTRGSRLASSKSTGGLGGLLGGLFGLSGRKLLGVVSGTLPRGLPGMRALLQWGTQDAYTYNNPDTQAGVSPYQKPAAAAAASQYGAAAPSGIGRVWPQNSNTSNLDIGLYGLGGYTLLPPGYNQTAVAKAAAQCPGIARIMTIQSMADTRRKR